MATLYKASEWQSPSGRWYVNCVDDLAGISGLWWVPCRILNLDPVDFILLLKNEYHASNFSYNREKDFLNYSWAPEDYAYAHKWLLYINRIARNKKAMY